MVVATTARYVAIVDVELIYLKEYADHCEKVEPEFVKKYPLDLSEEIKSCGSATNGMLEHTVVVKGPVVAGSCTVFAQVIESLALACANEKEQSPKNRTNEKESILFGKFIQVL